MKEKKEEEKASKLVWKPQKTDPNNLDDHIVKLRPKRSSVITITVKIINNNHRSTPTMTPC